MCGLCGTGKPAPQTQAIATPRAGHKRARAGAALPIAQTAALAVPASKAAASPRATYTAIQPDLEGVPQLDLHAIRTWVFPVHHDFKRREYQFSIVHRALMQNTLVSLPTGLGKTFIAAVVMYNFYRWFPRGQILFLAPTKPLVTQQVKACHSVAGIPLGDTAQLLGSTSPEQRERLWATKRMIFCTPQIFANDLASAKANAQRVVLLVVDEAHRAQGKYAYCSVCRKMAAAHSRFRVLALSATPGTDISRVADVCKNLLIECVEVRTTTDPDVAPYVHAKTVEKITVPLSPEMEHLAEQFAQQILGPHVARLADIHLLDTRNPSRLSQKAVADAMGKVGRLGLPGSVISEALDRCRTLLSLLPAYTELVKHGTVSFSQALLRFQHGTQAGGSGGAIRQAVVEAAPWRALMDHVRAMGHQDQHIVHPKLRVLSEEVRKHIQRKRLAGESANIIVFTETRASVSEVLRHFFRNDSDLVRAAPFVGQASSKATELPSEQTTDELARLWGITDAEQLAALKAAGAGQRQDDQLKIIERFRRGQVNVLIATSIGEEGLDIGEVGLIVMFDAVASPIRTVQRIGRTGRAGAGEIVVLVAPGREDEKFQTAVKEYVKISSFLRDNASRLQLRRRPLGVDDVLQGHTPACDERTLETGEFRCSQVAGMAAQARVQRVVQEDADREHQQQTMRAFLAGGSSPTQVSATAAPPGGAASVQDLCTPERLGQQARSGSSVPGSGQQRAGPTAADVRPQNLNSLFDDLDELDIFDDDDFEEHSVVPSSARPLGGSTTHQPAIATAAAAATTRTQPQTRTSSATAPCAAPAGSEALPEDVLNVFDTDDSDAGCTAVASSSAVLVTPQRNDGGSPKLAPAKLVPSSTPAISHDMLQPRPDSAAAASRANAAAMAAQATPHRQTFDLSPARAQVPATSKVQAAIPARLGKAASSPGYKRQPALGTPAASVPPARAAVSSACLAEDLVGARVLAQDERRALNALEKFSADWLAEKLAKVFAAGHSPAPHRLGPMLDLGGARKQVNAMGLTWAMPIHDCISAVVHGADCREEPGPIAAAALPPAAEKASQSTWHAVPAGLLAGIDMDARCPLQSVPPKVLPPGPGSPNPDPAFTSPGILSGHLSGNLSRSPASVATPGSDGMTAAGLVYTRGTPQAPTPRPSQLRLPAGTGTRPAFNLGGSSDED